MADRGNVTIGTRHVNDDNIFESSTIDTGAVLLRSLDTSTEKIVAGLLIAVLLLPGLVWYVVYVRISLKNRPYAGYASSMRHNHSRSRSSAGACEL